MKKLRMLFAAGALMALSSCLDTEEKIILTADNSGIYSMAFDLGRMLKMSGSLGIDPSSTERIKEKRDTTVYLKDLVMAADNLTAVEKALYRDGMIHVSLDEAKNEMKILMSTPFKDAADLTEIRNNFSTVLNKVKAFEKATGEKEKPGTEDEDLKMGAKSANPLGDQFTFVAKPGRISNTVTDIAAFKKRVTADSTLSMMTQMTGMMGDFNYRTIIVLPTMVKKYEGPGGAASADKKTITFFTTLAQLLEHPEKASYNIEF